MNYRWLKEMADLHHGRSTSPCTLPLQRTRIRSMSALLWCYRSQHRISQALSQVATAGLGTAMLYELIEKGKEILTDNNIPHGQCVICLYGFQENEAFTKTSCYHYFHCHCLARYIQHMERELQAQGQEEERQHAATKQKAVGVQCPVCREPLVYDLASLKAAPEPQQPMEPYQPNTESLRQQEELRRLYKRQQERGGIIDLEAERNRYFISLQQPPAPLEPESAVDASRGSQPPSALATELSTSSTAQPPQSLLPVASQYMFERIPGTGPNQQRLGESQKAILGRPRASRGPWRQPERRHLKGGEYSAPKGTSDTQEVLPPEKPPKEPMDLKPEEPDHQGVEGPPPHRTGDYARWGRPKSRTPGSSYPRLRRGRGAYPPGTRREPLSLESEDGS
ncbi:E3 ubiquitin-protein ligase RNF25 isoform X2 [Artibeus jamaicensis]|uniref:E3 ubiquitin-protein ligase RNF25 isoform X2 n=1 Tax=Artibeus jamaicensis TaxID=9417 RepID=UPI00235A81DA|nr:E3 ubiquitin-protein ligase RNF25 isoform X2 [Artibeus jamaicensis]XP_053525363.1 E3 ubiquitin-protein ligase RNF25 isoform X2 [Artibeus jamaicensis]XP_053525402.1 E3 ubiquitin-protein ligase RNF25 isoform X2 [Artibeus jamaicensis]